MFNRRFAFQGRGLIAVLAFVSLLALPGSVSSTTVIEMSTEDLAERAEIILRGRVLSSQSFWDDSRTRIYTEYVIESEENLKGMSQERVLKLRQWGGIVGDRGYYIPGIATFAPNEDIFAFFTNAHPRTGTRFTVGLSQGKYEVLKEESSGKDLLRRNLRGLTFYDAITDQTYEPDPKETPVYWDAMRATVLESLDSGATGETGEGK